LSYERTIQQYTAVQALTVRLDRRCQHVPVAWIRELESFDEGFVSGDEAVPDRLVHQLPKAVKLVRQDVGPVPAQRPEHLLEDLVSPPGLHQSSLRDSTPGP